MDGKRGQGSEGAPRLPAFIISARMPISAPKMGLGAAIPIDQARFRPLEVFLWLQLWHWRAPQPLLAAPCCGGRPGPPPGLA